MRRSGELLRKQWLCSDLAWVSPDQYPR